MVRIDITIDDTLTGSDGSCCGERAPQRPITLNSSSDSSPHGVSP
jgi:hypothetical protein